MVKDPALLRKRFLHFVEDRWFCLNTYDTNYKALPQRAGVYFFVDFDLTKRLFDIVYVGSSTNLFLRYKSHKIPMKIQSKVGHASVLYFIEMDAGFYDKEIKMIKKLRPKFNAQHKKA